MSNTYTCGCGSQVKTRGRSQHNRSKKHQKWENEGTTNTQGGTTNVQEGVDIIQCMICHDDVSNEKDLICGHKFCGGCIDRWLEGHNTCPVCRREIAEGNTREGSGRGVGVQESVMSEITNENLRRALNRMDDIRYRFNLTRYRINHDIENSRIMATRRLAETVATSISGMRNYGDDARGPSPRVRVVVDMISQMGLNEDEQFYLMTHL